MNCQKSDDATSSEKPAFQAFQTKDSFQSQDEVVSDPCDISESEVEQGGSTAWVVRKGLPPEEKEVWQTTLSEAKKEPPGS